MFWPFNRKKKQQKKYQLSEFSKRRVVNGKTQVYHDDSGEWIYWYLIASSTFDGDSACDTNKAYQDLSVSDTFRDSSITSSLSSGTDFTSSSYGSSSSSSDWGSSSSSSSSYDSGSSSSGFD